MVLEKVRKKWIFLFSPIQSCQTLYQFLFYDHVTFYFQYTYSHILIYFSFYSSMSQRDLFTLLLPSAFCNMQSSILIHVLMHFWIMSCSFQSSIIQSSFFILFLSPISISFFFLFNFHQSQFVCYFSISHYQWPSHICFFLKICLLILPYLIPSCFLNSQWCKSLFGVLSSFFYQKLFCFFRFYQWKCVFSLKSDLVLIFFHLKMTSCSGFQKAHWNLFFVLNILVEYL